MPLNCEEIQWNPEKFWNIKLFINKHNWKGINYSSKIDDWKTSKKKIHKLLLIFFLYIKEKEIDPAYISNINSNCDEKTILLMILSEEKKGWHYLVIKKLSALLHVITSQHKGDFYSLNCLHSFWTENILKSHEKVCKNKDFYGIVVPSE